MDIITACVGVERRPAAPNQAQTPDRENLPSANHTPRATGKSREARSVPACLRTTFRSPARQSPPCKDRFCIDSSCLHPNRQKKQPCWTDPSTTGFTTASLRTQAAKMHRPRCGSQHSQTHSSRSEKQGRVQQDRIGPVNQHLLMSILCQPLRPRRIVKHHSCHA